jgi:hypothetical protein
MIEEATVDAYGESEPIGGFYTMIVEHLIVPFETTLLGVPVTVRVSISPSMMRSLPGCSRGRLRQAIPIQDLVLSRRKRPRGPSVSRLGRQGDAVGVEAGCPDVPG